MVVESGTTTDSITYLDREWEIACEVPQRLAGTPWSDPHDTPATWVMWRANCCPQSPRYLLVCDKDKDIYQNIISRQGYISCVDCNAECDILSFTPLNKSRS